MTQLRATTDAEAYGRYPHHHNFFDKLWLAEYLGYRCGPAGYAPSNEDEIPDEVIVRPVYNLSGMGIGSYPLNLLIASSEQYLRTPIGESEFNSASKTATKKQMLETLPAGTFWCEKFEGDQLSTTYEWDYQLGQWRPVSTYKAVNVRWVRSAGTSQQRISSWHCVDHPSLDDIDKLNVLADVGLINIESVGGKIIEVHLRGSPDPVADVFIPIFAGSEKEIVQWSAKGYTFQFAYDDADGQLNPPRVGFMVLNP